MLKLLRTLAFSLTALITLICRPALADNLASGRNVQLEALDTKTAILLLDEKKLYMLDLRSGAAIPLADSTCTWFALDRHSQTVLVATRAKAGTDLTLYHFDHGAMNPVAKGFVRLVVAELQSMKSPDGSMFLLSCSEFAPPQFETGELPFWVHFANGSSPDGTLSKSPVPGLSEISDLLCCGTIGFAGDGNGTFAYVASVSSESLVAVKSSVKLPAIQPGANNFFLVVSGGKVKYAWPVPFAAQEAGRVIGFTPDGRTLLARLNIGADMFGAHDFGFKLIDLTTGKMTSWPLGNPYDVIAIDPTLKRALIQSQYAIPAPGTPADAPLKKPDSFPPGYQSRWRAELAEQGRPVLKVLQVDGGDVELAGTFIDGDFFATDGQTLAAVDSHDRVGTVPITFGK